MSEMFDSNGKLHIPFNLCGEIQVPANKIENLGDNYVVKEAYCPQGHSLMSNVKINEKNGINLIYTDCCYEREANIVLTPVIGKENKVTLSGDNFKEGEIVKTLCPTCKKELEILLDCDCGAPIYVFYLDKTLNHIYGHSFCSRVGCVKASKLRFSKDVLMEFFRKNAL